jgi:hypothetical protein
VSGLGIIKEIWKYDTDPGDAANPYTPYAFVPTGHTSAANTSFSRDFARRESIVSIPGADGVADAYGRTPGPIDKREATFGFRVFTTDGDLDKAYDLIAAWVAPGYPQRLIYITDAGYTRVYYVANPRYQHTLASANSWGRGGFVDFAVTWRVLKVRAPFSEASDRFTSTTETFNPAHDETFGSNGTTVIASPTQGFSIDARGTAGLDLPTLADRAPKIVIHGPAGGTGGFTVQNFAATTRDTNGIAQPVQFTVPFYLPTASDSASFDFAAQIFLHNGVPFRPTKPNYQREWFRVEPGVVNSCAFIGLPQGFGLTGGRIFIDWYRYFA